MSKEVIFSVSNDIVTDQRVLKVATEVSVSGADVTIIGRRLPLSLGTENLGFRIIRYSMLFRKGFLFYLFFNIRLLCTLLRRRPVLLVSNDLDTLPANFIVSRIKNVPLIYDSHEYFTGSPELAGRRFVKAVWRRIERFIIPRLQFMMTVNKSIADLYESEYGLDITVVRNFSLAWKGKVSLRSDLGIPEDHLLCVIQGTGLNVGRGGIELVEAISGTEGIHLMVIGRGDQIGAIRKRVFDLELWDRVTLLPVMPWEDMMRYTAMADVGLSLDKAGSLNYNNSLPNKIFDYMNAGLALIVTDLKEVSSIVKDSENGIIIKHPDPAEIRKALQKFRTDGLLLSDCKLRSKEKFHDYRWEQELDKLYALYSRAGLKMDVSSGL